MTGPEQIFEGPAGFLKVISHKPLELARLGGSYSITRTVTKRFALGQYSQSMAAAAVQLRPFFRNTDEIEAVNIQVSRNAIRVMAGSPDKWRPESHETADHSMPYAAAVLLMHGTIDDHYYEDPFLHDPHLLELVGRVHCSPSDEADLHEKDFNLCDFEIVLKSGARQSTRVEYQLGHWKNPMTDAELEEKFRSLAGRYLQAPKVDALLRQLWDLEKLPQAGKLIELTRV